MTSHSTRSRSWFQGRYFALANLTGAEVHDSRTNCSVQVSKTTLHGTPAQMRQVARQLMRAADLAEAVTAQS